MLYLTCTTITSVDLAHYGLSRAKDWVSVDCGTIMDLISQINNIQLIFCICEKLENKSKYMLQQAAARRSGIDQTPLLRGLV